MQSRLMISGALMDTPNAPPPARNGKRRDNLWYEILSN
jgi:hypothetical protein